MADRLEAVERGHLDRLMMFLPPRTGKTELLLHWIAWCLGRHPDWPMLYTSYGADLAWDKSGEARAIVQSDAFAEVFGKLGIVADPVEIAADSRSVQRWRIADHRGGLQAQGVGGPITGKGGQLIVIDDPVKNREEADSATYRKRAWDWYSSTLRTRLDPGGRMVLVTTRWHEDDLAGRLLKRAQEDPAADQWAVVCLPALAHSLTATGAVDPLGRQPGEALDPARYDAAALARIKASIGSRDWTALYDQAPRSDEGAVFRRAWLRYVDQLPELSYSVVVWDTAYETKSQSDYSAAVLVAQGLDGAYYVIPLIHDRLEFPELVRAAAAQMARWPMAEHIAEGRASGKSLRQQLRQSGLPLIEVEPQGDKVARANSVTRFFEAGLVNLVKGPGLDDFENELLGFPAAEHDDQVDALVYGLLRASKPAGAGGFML